MGRITRMAVAVVLVAGAAAFDLVDESEPGSDRLPPDVPIEGGADGDGDRHVIVVVAP